MRDWTTTKEQLLEAMKREAETPEDLVAVFWQLYSTFGDRGEVIQCDFDELPERKFDSGYGGMEGEPIIAFTKDRVYFKVVYDGMEWIDSVPRNPENVDGYIPVFGDV